VKSIHCRHVCLGQLTRSVINEVRITPNFISSRLQLQPLPLDTRSRPTWLRSDRTKSSHTQRLRTAGEVRETDLNADADGWDLMEYESAVTASQWKVALAPTESSCIRNLGFSLRVSGKSPAYNTKYVSGLTVPCHTPSLPHRWQALAIRYHSKVHTTLFIFLETLSPRCCITWSAHRYAESSRGPVPSLHLAAVPPASTAQYQGIGAR
jgi:hypothetical protein